MVHVTPWQVVALLAAGAALAVLAMTHTAQAASRESELHLVRAQLRELQDWKRATAQIIEHKKTIARAAALMKEHSAWRRSRPPQIDLAAAGKRGAGRVDDELRGPADPGQQAAGRAAVCGGDAGVSS